MTFIKPESAAARSEILSKLAMGTARRLFHVDIRPIYSGSITDTSGTVHWMYNFDEHENRIYRVQNGTQRFIDIDVGDDGVVDLDDISNQIEKALLELNVKDY
jgi:hypothetical protein